MIPDIGWIVCAYVITRMVSFLLGQTEAGEHPLVKVLALITIAIALLGAYDLTTKSADVGRILR